MSRLSPRRWPRGHRLQPAADQGPEATLTTTSHAGPAPDLCVCIVSYFSDASALGSTVASLNDAVRHAGCRTRLTLVDNTDRGADTPRLLRLVAQWAQDNSLGELGAIELRQSGRNLGYGQANNLGLLGAHGTRFLVLNPDVELQADTLSIALDYLDKHPACGLLAPRALTTRGEDLHLNHGLPTILALAGRAIPFLLKLPVVKRAADRYELRHLPIDQPHDQTVCASGCFMLFNARAFVQAGGFNPAFFMYFEDYDLSLRVARESTVTYVPTVRITHLGGGAAGKGFRHRGMFIASAFRFFQRHGWRWG